MTDFITFNKRLIPSLPFWFCMLCALLVGGCGTALRVETSREKGPPQLSIAGHRDAAFECQKPLQEHNTALLDPNNIHLISWNIYKGKKHGWQQDLYSLSDNQSIVVLQEAPLGAVEQVLENDPAIKDWRWQFAPGYKTSKAQTGVLTLSRSPARYYCHLSHKEPWLRSDKASLITRYAIENTDTELLVANFHGINFTLGVRAYRNQIYDLGKIIAKHTGPVIIAGDFNSWSKKRNRVLAQLFNELKLAKVEFESPHRKAFLGHPLDHVLFRGLAIKNKSVHRLNSSDHNPLQVNFRLLEP